MNPKIICLLAAFGLVLSGTAFAAGAKSYQITGTVVTSTGSMITVQKGTERWEIDIDPTVKGTADFKVGSTITITYVMSATKVEASGGSEKKAETKASPTP